MGLNVRSKTVEVDGVPTKVVIVVADSDLEMALNEWARYGRAHGIDDSISRSARDSISDMLDSMDEVVNPDIDEDEEEFV